ncbi:MAG TPA: HEAT repeat domain-containing protein [Actinomycetota bacterium]|nr:HEAT repeat domain-containing protein [Actinomycetota bacterium]
MSVTREHVTAALKPEEPDYDEAVRLGPEALTHLHAIVEEGDPNLAAKAAYLAGRIGEARAVPILETAAVSPDPSIRAAAAGGLRHLSERQAEPILLRLVDDENAGIRKAALLAVPDFPSLELEEKLNRRRRVETQPAIRDLADRVHTRVSINNRRLRGDLPGGNDG